jgi:hypothetical protein
MICPSILHVLSVCAHLHVQYGEFRSGYDKDEEDTRIVFYGLRYLLENYVGRRWTVEDVDKADLFYK